MARGKGGFGPSFLSLRDFLVDVLDMAILAFVIAILFRIFG